MTAPERLVHGEDAMIERATEILTAHGWRLSAGRDGDRYHLRADHPEAGTQVVYHDRWPDGAMSEKRAIYWTYVNMLRLLGAHVEVRIEPELPQRHGDIS